MDEMREILGYHVDEVPAASRMSPRTFGKHYWKTYKQCGHAPERGIFYYGSGD